MSSWIAQINAKQVAPADPKIAEIAAQAFKARMCSDTLWFFMVAGIIVIVILFYIITLGHKWYWELNLPVWGKHTSVWAILLIIVTLVMCYATYLAYTKNFGLGKTGLIISFVLSLILILVWAYVFYVQHNLNLSFRVGILVLVVAIIQSYLVWSSCHKAIRGMIPYLLWLLALVYLSFQTAETNAISS